MEPESAHSAPDFRKVDSVAELDQEDTSRGATLATTDVREHGRGPISFIGPLIGLVVMSVVAGLLVAVSIAPVAAVAGSAAQSTAGVFSDLPADITLTKLPQRNRIFAVGAKGKAKQIATVYNQNRQEDTWDEISPYLKDAAVGGEDKTFYTENGVDLPALARAAVSNITTGAIQSGASTIPMQVVRNVAVQDALQLSTTKEQDAAYDAAISDTLSRKLKEIKLAVGLEKAYSKRQILLAYLNIANFGNANYGVEAAAQAYFSTTAAKVTPAQAASIIAIVQNPSSRNLSSPKNYAANLSRRNYILKAMYTAKNITQAQYETAVNTAIDSKYVKLSTPKNGCLATDASYRWICDYVVRTVDTIPALGATASIRTANWKVGGYDIYTTFNLAMQKTATATLQAQVPAVTSFQLGGATSTVQPGTGKILVMAENKTFNNTLHGGNAGTTAVNYNVDEKAGGSTGFQPGSTYKLFTLLDWLEKGNTLDDTFNASVRSLPESDFTASCAGGVQSGVPYTFQNDENEQGITTVKYATTRSINSVFIQMATKLDLCDIRNIAKSLGVHNGNGTALAVNPACVIGGCTNAIAPLTMAAAYAAVADGGIYCSPIAVSQVVTSAGTKLGGQDANCHRVLSASVANTAALALEGPISSAGTGANANPNDGTALMGKTGTTDNSLETWIVASSTKASTAVWVGNVSGKQPLRSIYVNGVQAAVLRLSVYRGIMTYIDSRVGGAAAFPTPDQALISPGSYEGEGGYYTAPVTPTTPAPVTTPSPVTPTPAPTG
jgi:membrane peptidoglycan carboxypeptidase